MWICQVDGTDIDRDQRAVEKMAELGVASEVLDPVPQVSAL
jgi:hypothetical protein